VPHPSIQQQAAENLSRNRIAPLTIVQKPGHWLRRRSQCLDHLVEEQRDTVAVVLWRGQARRQLGTKETHRRGRQIDKESAAGADRCQQRPSQGMSRR